MSWNLSAANRQLDSIFQKPPAKSPVYISLQSTYRSGTAEFLDTFIARAPDNSFFISRYNFEYQQHRPANFQLQAVRELFRNDEPLFRSFLENFSPAQQQYLVEVINALPEVSPDRKTAVRDLFFQFLHSLNHNRKFVFIFENIQQIDASAAEILRRKLERLSVLPLFIIYSSENPGNGSTHFPVDLQVTLPGLSVREVARNIRKYFNTSAINARIITNNCYFKTAGDPLKIRLLLEGHYRRLLPDSPHGFINIKQMQQLRVSGDWQFILQQLFSQVNEQTQITLGILAYLGGRIETRDFENILVHFRFSDFSLPRWIQAGLLRKFTLHSRSYIRFGENILRDWFYQSVAVERLKKHLRSIYQLHCRGKLNEVYRISHVFYELGETDISLRMARNEAEDLIQSGRYREASERLYFLVRHADIFPDESDFHLILQQLGEVYLKLGVNENAFEILRRLRDEKIRSLKPSSPTERESWISINLKLVQALIQMDAFQEAKYILRDVRSKKFCSFECKGRSYELLGDIELNFNRENVAREHYLTALKLYQKAAAPFALFSVYQKLKRIVRFTGDSFEAFLSVLGKETGQENRLLEIYCYLFRDWIKYQIKSGLLEQAVRNSCRLRRELRKIYHPQVVFQLSFLLSEVYSLRGKWKFALSHLERIIAHPVAGFYPPLLVQAYVQSALVFKEQAIYGRAERLFKKAMALCAAKGYSARLNEIKLHLGHMYLLVHSFPRAREFLKQAHDSAAKFHQTDLLTLAKLYLSYYEMKQKRWEGARQFLREANTLIKSGGTQTDHLNYLYYIGLWLLETGSTEKAARVIQLFNNLAAGNPRYLAAAGYLEVKLLSERKDFPAAQRRLREILKITEKQSLPQVRYLLLCEAVWLVQKFGSKNQIRRQIEETNAFIRKMAEGIDDPIFATQFLESGYHEKILKSQTRHGKAVEV